MSFRLIFEIEPPRIPDLGKVAAQIDIFGPIVDAILVPDNHLGLPAMSSLTIALEIAKRGFHPIVALNARDRNHLRFKSDILTLNAYGIHEVLFLYGDPIDHGRSSLKVKQMLSDPVVASTKRGVAATIGKPLGWRASADFLFTQLEFGRGKAGYWREAEGFSQPVYCGVIALPDLVLARKVIGNIPGLEPPPGFFESFSDDPDAGFHAAISELDDLYRSGVDGAQLVVPAGRRRFAAMLEGWIADRGIR
ncbi:MAG: hypothetical protein ABIS18_10975 [Actinomycetota bacterium]